MSAHTEETFAWVTDNNPTISYIRIIAAGSWGVVHELYDNVAGKAFARKTIALNHNDSIVAVENEARAITKLCKPPAHENVVAVLRHGYLQDQLYCFFDMELCQIDLGTYIQRKWTPIMQQPLQPPSVPKDRVRNAMYIMIDIAKGVSYIHSKGEVHRDLKPSNGSSHRRTASLILVLYSLESGLWKIADFGLTAEGGSLKMMTTDGQRGTSSYRAPELLKEDGKYNNKVDIWAIGCILYELISEQKAFINDIDVLEWSFLGQEKRISPETPLDDAPRKVISQLIRESLNRDPRERPTAKYIYTTLGAFFGHSNEDNSDQVREGQEAISPVKAEIHGAHDLEYEVAANWDTMRPHMPPWINFDSKKPLLCHQLKLQIELSGRGHVDKSSHVTATTSHCVLFKNMLIFCKGSFIARSDETAPLSVTNLRGLGIVFLQNLNPKTLLPKTHGERSKTLAFTLSLNLGDRISFNFPETSKYLSRIWYDTLKQCLSHIDVSGISGIIEVKCHKILLTSQPPFNMHEVPGASCVVRLSFAMIEPGFQISVEIANGEVVYLLETGEKERSPTTHDLIFSAAHRFKVLRLVVKSYNDTATFHRRGGKPSWREWLRSRDALQSLMNAFQDIEEPNKTKESPLHWAAYLGIQELIESLLEGGVGTEARNYAGETPLHSAAQNGTEDVVKLLFEYQANLDVQDKEGRTILHHAAVNGRAKVAALLIDEYHGLLEKVDRRGFRALHFAAETGQADVVKALLVSGANAAVQTVDKRTPLHLAAQYGYAEVVKILLGGKPDIKTIAHSTESGSIGTALDLAVRYGQTEVVKLLLEANSGLTIENATLKLAMRYGHQEVMTLLLEAKVKGKHADLERMLSWAASNGHKRAAEMLREHKENKKHERKKGKIWLKSPFKK